MSKENLHQTVKEALHLKWKLKAYQQNHFIFATLMAWKAIKTLTHISVNKFINSEFVTVYLAIRPAYLCSINSTQSA